MVFLRILRWLVWPRREKEWEDEKPRRRPRGSRSRPSHRSHQPGVYRIEVDSEAGRFHNDGLPFSFWSSSRVILILAFLLWWIQPAGPMIAGYVGGRRAGSPMKAVIAALMPVFAIFIANASYAHSVAARQVDFVASLPTIVSDGLSSILPFLVPYRDFMISYMAGFVSALTTTFGMGTNGYLMVVIFAYIGGLIAEQTRRELVYRSGSGSSFGVNLVQPVLGARPYVEEDEADEDGEVHRSRHPVRARARRRPAVVVLDKGHRRRDRGPHFESYRKVSAREYDEDARGLVRIHRRHEEDEEDDEEGEEVVVRRTHRIARDREDDEPEPHRKAHHRPRDDEDDEAREEAPSRTVRTRSAAEERAIQRFVERALRNYDHSKL